MLSFRTQQGFGETPREPIDLQIIEHELIEQQHARRGRFRVLSAERARTNRGGIVKARQTLDTAAINK